MVVADEVLLVIAVSHDALHPDVLRIPRERVDEL